MTTIEILEASGFTVRSKFPDPELIAYGAKIQYEVTFGSWTDYWQDDEKFTPKNVIKEFGSDKYKEGLTDGSRY